MNVLGGIKKEEFSFTLSIADLQFDADNGDNEAAGIIAQIAKYQQRKIERQQEKVRGFVGRVTTNLSKSIDVISRDVSIWKDVRDVCDEAIELIEPHSDEIEIG